MIQRVVLVFLMLLGLAGFGAIAMVAVGPARHGGAMPPPPQKVAIVTAASLLSAVDSANAQNVSPLLRNSRNFRSNAWSSEL